MLLETDVLRIRDLKEEDKDAIKVVFDYLLDDEQVERFLMFAHKENRTILAIEKKDIQTMIGYLEVTFLAKGIVEIGYRIQSAYRKQHFCRESVYQFVKYAHEELDVHTVLANVKEDNPDSIHVLEHNGFACIKNENGMRTYKHQAFTAKKNQVELKDEEKVIYFAGGCFWGTERIFQMLDGVIKTNVGYANGDTENPTYEDVCRNDTGFKECVQVIYNPVKISLDILLEAFFLCIDPTVQNRQGNDIGSQYQTGVYYVDELDRAIIEERFNQEKQKHASFYVELEPLSNYYSAEEYHQKYLDKNPNGYCHITPVELEKVKMLNQRKESDYD